MLRVHSRLTAHYVGLDDRGQVVADGVLLDGTSPGVTALASQMSGHHLARLDFEAAVTPAELLTVARLLAEPPAAERPGHVFSTRLDGNAIVQVIPTVARSERPPAPQASAPAHQPAFVGEDATSLLFSAVRAPTGSAEELLERLHATRDVDVASRLLDEFCSVVERAHGD